MRTTLFRRNEFYLLLVIVAFSLGITIVNPAFFTVENMFDLIRSSSGMAILAIGFFVVGWMNQSAARRLERQIDALTALEKEA